MTDQQPPEEAEPLNLFDLAAEYATQAEGALRDARTRSWSERDVKELLYQRASAEALTSIAFSLVEISLSSRDLSHSLHTEQASIDAILADQLAAGTLGTVSDEASFGIAGKRAMVTTILDDGTVKVERVDRPGVTFVIKVEQFTPDEPKEDPDE